MKFEEMVALTFKQEANPSCCVKCVLQLPKSLHWYFIWNTLNKGTQKGVNYAWTERKTKKPKQQQWEEIQQQQQQQKAPFPPKRLALILKCCILDSIK